MRALLLLSFATLLTLSCAEAAITVGSVDGFDSSNTDTEGWVHGQANARAPAVNVNAGQNGNGDNAMGFSSTGSGRVASRFIAFNRSPDWTGDYVTAGVTGVQVDVNNTGSNDIFLRFAVQNRNGLGILTTNSMLVTPGSGWQTLTFSLELADLSGVGTPNDDASKLGVLGAVEHVQLFSAEQPPTAPIAIPRGDQIAAEALFDNITVLGTTAIPEPSPIFALGVLLCVALLARKGRSVGLQFA